MRGGISDMSRKRFQGHGIEILVNVRLHLVHRFVEAFIGGGEKHIGLVHHTVDAIEDICLGKYRGGSSVFALISKNILYLL